LTDVWVFGYGSLIWRPAFAFVERRRAVAHGWARRFAQRSTDHRGTADAPGRVATMLAVPGERCVGAAYRISADASADVLAELDIREQQGYERIALDVALDDGVVPALTYVAPPGNPWFVTGETAAEIAAIVRVAHGPSGANLEYAQRLAAALAELDAHDPQLDEILALAAAPPAPR
jgi:cation transport regulator ChaC